MAVNRDNSYTNLSGNGQTSSAWLEKQQSGSRKSKFILIGALVGLLALIAIGVGVGVSLSNKNRKSNGGSNNNSTSGNNNNSSNPNPGHQNDPNDPSNFTKDPNLKQSFYGMAYTPNGALYPNCNATLQDVISDVQIMSQLTKHVRLYTSDCDLSHLILEAIKQTKVDMMATLGVYVSPDGDYTAYERQRVVLEDALKKYGTDHIAGITVGNEYMLNYLTNNGGGEDPNSAVGNKGADQLIVNITDTRNLLKSLGLSVPVGNSDAGSYFNTKVLQAVDYGMANVHPWFAHTTSLAGAQWTWDFFQETNVNPAALLSNKPEMSIAEVGWPTASKDAEHATNGGSPASEQDLQTFMDNFVCQSNAKGIKYYFFELFDEKWKDDIYGGVEGHWGLLHQNKTLKRITLPDCPI